jgi:hypothetical protein
MPKFWIGLLSGILVTMLFYEHFPGGAPEALVSIEQQVKSSTP